MPKNNNREKFNRLREEFPFLAYDGFDYQYSDKGLRVQFHFSLSDKYVFHPTMMVPATAECESLRTPWWALMNGLK